MVSIHFDCLAAVHLIYTMEIGYVQLKNYWVQQKKKSYSSQQNIRSSSNFFLLN